MNQKLSKTLKYVLSAALMVVLLYFAFRSVEWDAFLNGIRSTNFLLVAVAMCFGFSAFVFRSIRWKMLLKPLDPDISFWRVFSGVNIGNFANCMLPFAGEIARCGIVCTPKANFEKTFGTIAMERIWDFVSIMFIMLVALVIEGGAVSEFFSRSVWTPLAENFYTTWWIYVIFLAVCALAVWALFKFRKKGGVAGKVYDFFAGIGKGFISFSKMDHKGLFLTCTFCVWIMYWLMCVCIAKAFPPANSLAISDTLFIMAVGNLASVIPVPGGFGAYHAIIALALSSIYGMSWQNGIVFATLSHESQAIVMISSGVVSYILRMLGFKNK